MLRGYFFSRQNYALSTIPYCFVVLRVRVTRARLTDGGPLMVQMSKFVVVMNMLGVMTMVASVLAFHG